MSVAAAAVLADGVLLLSLLTLRPDAAGYGCGIVAMVVVLMVVVGR